MKHHLRLITYNVLGLRGFPAQSGGPIAFALPSAFLITELAKRIDQWQADIVILQEAPPATELHNLAKLCGLHAAFLPAQMSGGPQWPFGFPGAVLSRSDIADIQDRAAGCRDGADDPRFHRHWGSATVTLPGGPLTVTSTHLCADWGGIMRETTRCDEVAALLAAAPTDLIAADCNTRPGEAPWQALRAAGWRDAWLESGADGAGLTSDTRTRTQRIDYLWLAPGCPWRAARAQVLPDQPLTVDGLEVLLSDHHPLLIDLERGEATGSR